ncbi:MAG: hypothetical protein J6C46_11275 [Clostridia bacterium]|nr:hypothetical protein [Clostridia bacterium]
MANISVAVSRIIWISVDKLSESEKIAIARTSTDKEVLKVLAVDESRKVKLALLENDVSYKIGSEVLDILYDDSDEIIKGAVKSHIISYLKKDSCMILPLMLFVNLFFKSSLNLNNPKNVQAIHSAFYVYITSDNKSSYKWFNGRSLCKHTFESYSVPYSKNIEEYIAQAKYYYHFAMQEIEDLVTDYASNHYFEGIKGDTYNQIVVMGNIVKHEKPEELTVVDWIIELGEIIFEMSRSIGLNAAIKKYNSQK